MGPLELDQFKEMLEARSKNGCDPWFAKDDSGAGHAPYGYGENPPPMGLWRHGGTVLAETEDTLTVSSVEPFSDADAQFIAAAWFYVPKMITQIEAFRSEIASLRDRLSKAEGRSE